MSRVFEQVNNGLRYVRIVEDSGGSMLIPYEDWEEAKLFLHVDETTPDLLQRIRSELYVEVPGTRLVHEW